MRKMFSRLIVAALVVTSLLTSAKLASAEDGGHEMKTSEQSESIPPMPGMEGMPGDMPGMQASSLIESLLQHATSGTDASPTPRLLPC